ncbi:MAG TPA: cytochrome c biogenesis protein ResB, partial [Verrucomicrobiae bacterium]|nr:cytochrome c biogenesis protein ResB [Verrucomicrobiae bacterium]
MQKILLFIKSLVIRFRDIMKSPADLYRFLGSKGLSVFSLGLLIGLYTVWLLPFQIYGIPSQVVKNIANREWFFQAAYVLFFLNALLCLIQSIPLNLRRIRLAGRMPGNDRFRLLQHRVVLSGCRLLPESSRHFKGLLRRKGYWNIGVTQAGMAAFRGRLSPMGSILLHASFFLIPLGLLVSSYTAVTGYAVITEGQSFEGSNAQSYVSLNPDKAKKNSEMLPPV